MRLHQKLPSFILSERQYDTKQIHYAEFKFWLNNLQPETLALFCLSVHFCKMEADLYLPHKLL